MVAAKLLLLLSASLHTIRRQRSAERGQQNDGSREAITASDTPLAKRGGACPARMGQGCRQMVAAELLWQHCTRSAASVA
jgi:hypothetical protein